jgi:hypothetical protein
MRAHFKMLHRARTRRGERGQMIMIIALLVTTVTFLIGVVAVDAGMWQSERRGAQKDVDFSALAGAYELLLDQDQTDAENAAIAYANTNDEAGNATEPAPGTDPMDENVVVVDDACFPGNDILPLNAVTVNVDHGSRTLFSDIFGFDAAPHIEAHARACAGSINRPTGLRPFIVSIEDSPCFTGASGDRLPDYGATCTLDFGAHTDTEGNDIPGGNRGVADLEVPNGQCSNVPGSGDLEEIIENGAPAGVVCATQSGTTCTSPYVNCVVGQTGNVADKTIDGLAAMLANEGGCDASYAASPDNAGVDDFAEALELVSGPGGNHPDNIYAPRPCNAAGDTSPRLITIFAVEDWQGSNDPMPIVYFLTVYVEGCKQPNQPVRLKCTGFSPPIQKGQIEVRGRIIKAFLAEIGEVGAPNAGGSFAISLDE